MDIFKSDFFVSSGIFLSSSMICCVIIAASDVFSYVHCIFFLRFELLEEIPEVQLQ